MIHVASEYTRESFLEAGVPAEKLQRVQLSIPERYRPAPRERDDETFRVLYVGALTVTKGVPVLLEAFRQLTGDAELVLVGGWGTRGMRQYVQSRLAADPRIRVVSGDPLVRAPRGRRPRPSQLQRRLRVRPDGGARVRNPGDRDRRHRNEGACPGWTRRLDRPYRIC